MMPLAFYLMCSAVVALLAAVPVCFLKRKDKQGWLGIFSPVVPVLISLYFWRRLSGDMPADWDSTGWAMANGLGWAGLVLLTSPMWLGFAVSSIVGAVRIAKPDSWWARRFYGPERLAAARHAQGRFPTTRAPSEREDDRPLP